uniref:YrhK domain-containing protein n=1 Tax=Alexandrium monilatum TaxID=311494 RepID=A0A7S4RDQ7_9DINO
MVHLVSERPRDALLPVLLEHCCNCRQGPSRPGSRKHEPWWKTVFPVYYELLYVTVNAIFLVGSILFLPIFEGREPSVTFSMTVLNVDEGKLRGANRTLLDAFEQSIVRTISDEAGMLVGPERAHLRWHATKSCKLDRAIILDSAVFPPWGVNAMLIQERLVSAALPSAVNRSLWMVPEIESITTGPMSVQMLSKPAVTSHETSGKWAIDLGCDLYILGSLLLALLSMYDMFEDILACCFRSRHRAAAASSSAASSHDASHRASANSTNGTLGAAYSPLPTGNSPYRFLGEESPTDAAEKKKVSERETARLAEKALYLMAALVFLVGTVYFQHPKTVAARMPTVEEADVLNMAIAMFIGGSAVFCFAAFLNALSLTAHHTTFGSWAVAVCGIYECGGILFVVGSVCFTPNQGCGKGMEEMGAWSFILGSSFYVFGGVLEVVKTVALLFLQKQQEAAAKKISKAYASMLVRRRVTSTVDAAVSSHRRSQAQAQSAPLVQRRAGLDASSASNPSQEEDNGELWQDGEEERLREDREESSAAPESSQDMQQAEMAQGDQSHPQQQQQQQQQQHQHQQEDGRPQALPAGSEGQGATQGTTVRPQLPGVQWKEHYRERRHYSATVEESSREQPLLKVVRAHSSPCLDEAGPPGLWSTFFQAMAAKEKFLQGTRARRASNSPPPTAETELSDQRFQSAAGSSAEYPVPGSPLLVGPL